MREFVKKHAAEMLMVATTIVLILCSVTIWTILRMDGKITDLESQLSQSSTSDHATISSYDIEEILRNVRDTNEKVNSISETVNDIDFELRY